MVSTNMGGANDRRGHGETGSEFFTFLQALRSRFSPTDGAANPVDDELLDFAIDDDEFLESTSVPTAPTTPVADPMAAEAPPDLPLELAPPLPRWHRIAGELAAGFAALAAIELFLGRGLGSLGIHPHPYWLVVLPIAAAHGLVAGLTAATIAAALYFAGALAVVGTGHWLDLLTYQHGIEPLAFGLVAFLVGDLRDRADVRTHGLWRALMHSASERARILAKARQLQGSNHDLKVRLLDHSAQFGHLLDAARRLETAGRRELLEVAIDMVAEHCRGERASALEFDGRAPHVLAMKGWATTEVDLLMQQAGMAEPVQRAWDLGERYNAFAAAQLASPHGPLLIAPICRDDGTVDALLCLDAIPPEQYSQGLASIFFGIAEWVQIGLQRLERGDGFTAAPDIHKTVANGWVGDPIDLGARLQIEQVRMSRLRVRSCLLAIQTQATSSGPERERDQRRFEQLLEATMLNGLLRSSDTLYRTGHPGTWVIVLPATPDESALVVKSRIETFLGAMKLGTLRAFHLQIFAPTHPGATLAGLVGDIAGWTARQIGIDVDLGIPTTPQPHRIDDVVGLAKRLETEAHLSRRWVTDLYAVHLQVEAVRIDQPELLPQVLQELAARFLDEAASVHELEAGNYALLLPFVNCHAAFHIGHEMARALGGRFSGSAGSIVPVEFSVYALAGRPDEGHFLLDRLLRRTPSVPIEPAPVEVAS